LPDRRKKVTLREDFLSRCDLYSLAGLYYDAALNPLTLDQKLCQLTLPATERAASPVDPSSWVVDRGCPDRPTSKHFYLKELLNCDPPLWAEAVPKFLQSFFGLSRAENRLSGGCWLSAGLIVGASSPEGVPSTDKI